LFPNQCRETRRTETLRHSPFSSDQIHSVLDTLPPGTDDETRYRNRAGAIVSDDEGKWIFVSNRGTDTVSMLKKDGEGILTPVCVVPSGAEDPRDIAVLDHYLMIGHQKGKKITVLKYTENAELSDTGYALDMPAAPVCISVLNRSGE